MSQYYSMSQHYQTMSKQFYILHQYYTMMLQPIMPRLYLRFLTGFRTLVINFAIDFPIESNTHFIEYIWRRLEKK